MFKTLLSLKVLVDANARQILGQNEAYILYFLPPSTLFQKYSRATSLKVSDEKVKIEKFAGYDS